MFSILTFFNYLASLKTLLKNIKKLFRLKKKVNYNFLNQKLKLLFFKYSILNALLL